MNFSKDYTEQDHTYDMKRDAVLALPLRTIMLRKNYEDDIFREYTQALINDKWRTLPDPVNYDEFYDQYLA